MCDDPFMLSIKKWSAAKVSALQLETERYTFSEVKGILGTLA